MAVKDNQPKLHEAVCNRFIEIHDKCDDTEVRHFRTRSKDHGREVERHYYVSSVPESWDEIRAMWPGIQSIGEVATFTERDGKETVGMRYFISSLPPAVKRFANAVRGHWEIENSLHWVMDVSFDEDSCRIRKDHGPENFSLLRRFAAMIGAQPHEAAACASRTPADALRARRGRIRAGWPADMTLLRSDGSVAATFVGGELAYHDDGGS